MYARLATLADPNNFDENLDDTLELTREQIDRYYPVWSWWRATDRKFRISELMDEPHEPMMVILEIDNVYEKIVAQLRQNGRQGEDSSRDTT